MSWILPLNWTQKNSTPTSNDRTKWQQVAYAFNAENDANIPDQVPSSYDAMLDIGILNGVKAHKATGPDEVLARLLKEAADQFAIHSPCRMANSKRNPNLQEG